MNYEKIFGAIDNILWTEDGCSTELDYIEQKSWLLFLKYLTDYEDEQEGNAILNGSTYQRIIVPEFRWNVWAAPKKADGTIDEVKALKGEDLIHFVNEKLFPYLRKFKNTAAATNTLEYKVGVIFSELKNKINSGANLREIINRVDELHFQRAEEKHEMTVLYEANIQRMGNAGRNGGEYYTPRPLIRTIVKIVDPKIGETVYDPACGSAGFLCEAFVHMKAQYKSVDDYSRLQRNTFYGCEKKSLPYIIATMNMIFHGVEAPNILRGNTLAQNLSQITEKDRKNIILANPPFGGKEVDEVKQNFEIKTSETAYMFMQHFIRMLKTGGRAGIVIKNTFLSNGDAAPVRKMLLEECNVHTILDLPSGVFQGAGVKTVVLFFTKGTPTKDILYYQIDKHFTKTQPLTEADLKDFVECQKTREVKKRGNAWIVDTKYLGEDYDLSVKNPCQVTISDARNSKQILDDINLLVGDMQSITKEIGKIIAEK